MATVKRIEGSAIHKIQAGQVIVDLTSAVKELVENAIDAGATSIDIRFKNYGLDSIEVQDNGSGIAKDDFESIALKHYTSKLSTFEDLDSLHTYGFRGEALSSLCAVAFLHITTARQDEAPQGTKLEFETSGKLKSTSIVACQQGTTIFVTDIFRNLIVRRKDLEKNIRREYTKALNLLQAYACICTGVRISVSNTVSKQKKDVFRTRGDQSSRENIANVFGAKTLTYLVPLDLKLEMKPSTSVASNQQSSTVQFTGHISAPICGGGRQTSDRQLFYVNSRPCSLPQFVKVFNEVYKSYNMSQSPFIFANIILDTNAYDVNVSPDKRMIMLHNQAAMLDSIRSALTDMFESQQQSVPQAAADPKLASQKQMTIRKESSLQRQTSLGEFSSGPEEEEEPAPTQKSVHLISKFAARGTRLRSEGESNIIPADKTRRTVKDHQNTIGFDEYDDVPKRQKHPENPPLNNGIDEYDDVREMSGRSDDGGAAAHVRAFNAKLAEIQARDHAARLRAAGHLDEAESQLTNTTQKETIPVTAPSAVKDIPGVVPSAFNRMRPLRLPAETAIITIGDKTSTAVIGSQKAAGSQILPSKKAASIDKPFGGKLRSFMASGTADESTEDNDSESDDQIEESDPIDSVIKLKRRQSNLALSKDNIDSRGQHTDNKLPANLEDGNSMRSQPLDTSTRDADVTEDTLRALEEEDVDSESPSNSTDDEYVDDETKKSREDRKVSKLIEAAEARYVPPIRENATRMKSLLGGGNRESTVRLKLTISTSVKDIAKQFSTIPHDPIDKKAQSSQESSSEAIDDPDAESRLSVTVSKSDFSRMRIVGQFNLGFILAVRPQKNPTTQHEHNTEELFIIDQHASDEKYNFERLQQITTLQHQRLVRPQTLDLTAVEEEVLANNTTALRANGFHVTIDDSGDAPVGKRCTVHALPTSREVTFSTTDLEELLALLSVSEDPDIDTPLPTSSLSLDGKYIPRPSKVRKLFAMRACRSSIMIGKTLTHAQMQKLVANMGTIDKPWNCPHGRPTMRHLRSLHGVSDWMGQEREEDVIDWEKWLRE